MNRHPFHPRDFVGTAAIGGVALIVLPQYALSIVQIVLVTAAVTAALLALEVNVPSTGWMSPFKWMSPFGRGESRRQGPREPHEIRSMRSMLSGWRQPVPSGPPMTPDSLRLLRPLIRRTLDLDPESDAQIEAAKNVLSPLAWAVMTSDRRRKAHWFQMLPPNRRKVAEAVHRVLDEIDRLDLGLGDPGETMDILQP